MAIAAEDRSTPDNNEVLGPSTSLRVPLMVDYVCPVPPCLRVERDLKSTSAAVELRAVAAARNGEEFSNRLSGNGNLTDPYNGISKASCAFSSGNSNNSSRRCIARCKPNIVEDNNNVEHTSSENIKCTRKNTSSSTNNKLVSSNAKSSLSTLINPSILKSSSSSGFAITSNLQPFSATAYVNRSATDSTCISLPTGTSIIRHSTSPTNVISSTSNSARSFSATDQPLTNSFTVTKFSSSLSNSNNAPSSLLTSRDSNFFSTAGNPSGNPTDTGIFSTFSSVENHNKPSFSCKAALSPCPSGNVASIATCPSIYTSSTPCSASTAQSPAGGSINYLGLFPNLLAASGEASLAHKDGLNSTTTVGENDNKEINVTAPQAAGATLRRSLSSSSLLTAVETFPKALENSDVSELVQTCKQQLRSIIFELCHQQPNSSMSSCPRPSFFLSKKARDEEGSLPASPSSSSDGGLPFFDCERSFSYHSERLRQADGVVSLHNYLIAFGPWLSARCCPSACKISLFDYFRLQLDMLQAADLQQKPQHCQKDSETTQTRREKIEEGSTHVDATAESLHSSLLHTNDYSSNPSSTFNPSEFHSQSTFPTESFSSTSPSASNLAVPTTRTSSVHTSISPQKTLDSYEEAFYEFLQQMSSEKSLTFGSGCSTESMTTAADKEQFDFARLCSDASRCCDGSDEAFEEGDLLAESLKGSPPSPHAAVDGFSWGGNIEKDDLGNPIDPGFLNRFVFSDGDGSLKEDAVKTFSAVVHRCRQGLPTRGNTQSSTDNLSKTSFFPFGKSSHPATQQGCFRPKSAVAYPENRCLNASSSHYQDNPSHFANSPVQSKGRKTEEERETEAVNPLPRPNLLAFHKMRTRGYQCSCPSSTKWRRPPYEGCRATGSWQKLEKAKDFDKKEEEEKDGLMSSEPLFNSSPRHIVRSPDFPTEVSNQPIVLRHSHHHSSKNDSTAHCLFLLKQQSSQSSQGSEVGKGRREGEATSGRGEVEELSSGSLSTNFQHYDYDGFPRIPGVRFNAKKQQWLAAWNDNTREIRRYFSVARHGFQKAHSLAIRCRQDAERKGAKCKPLSTIHGPRAFLNNTGNYRENMNLFLDKMCEESEVKEKRFYQADKEKSVSGQHSHKRIKHGKMEESGTATIISQCNNKDLSA